MWTRYLDVAVHKLRKVAIHCTGGLPYPVAYTVCPFVMLTIEIF